MESIRVLRGGVAICALASLSVSCLARRAEESPNATAQEAEKSGGTGTKHKGAEGMMGSPAASATAPIAFDSDGNGPAKKKMAPPGVPLAGNGMGYGGGGGGIGLGTVGGFGHGAGSGGSIAVTPTIAPVVALDPNARYATTYRPGGATLAAFDAALAHGSLPTATKDLVGDFAGKYAPAMATPKTEGMTFAVDLERTAVAPAGGDVHVRIAMKGADGKLDDGTLAPWAIARAPLDVHVVLDISGSMQGFSIIQAKKAAETLVTKLAPGDRFSMTTFSNSAQVIVPAGLIGPRRASVIDTIHTIQADGGTNISSGLDLGYAEAQKAGSPEGAVKVVMLLSDGHANGGDTNPKTLSLRAAKAFQEGVQTSTFGIGTDFDANLMSTIADRGAGGYYYLADAAQIAPALEKELEARLQPVAQALEIRVRLRNDVAATKVYGSQALDDDLAALVRAQEVAVDAQVKKAAGIAKDRDEDAKGGMRFFIPAFARGDRHAMLLSVHVPAGSAPRVIASIEIKYKDRVTKKNVTREIPVKIEYAKDEASSAQTIVSSVSGTVQAFSAGDSIVRAAQLVDKGDRAGAAAMLRERAKLLRAAKQTYGDASFGDDAARIDRLADAVVGEAEVQDPMVLAVLLRGSSSGYLR
jgi:Ca-activated chloride channel family protein